MDDQFDKLTQVVPLKHTTSLDVAKSFVSHWVFAYGAPRDVLSDNVPQFASKLYQNTCKILSISNIFTSAHHPQTTKQVELFNRSIAAILRFYVSEHPENWNEYTEPLTHAYQINIHRAIGIRRFEFRLSCPPQEVSLHYDEPALPPTGKELTNFAEQLQRSFSKARTFLDNSQRRYKPISISAFGNPATVQPLADGYSSTHHTPYPSRAVMINPNLPT